MNEKCIMQGEAWYLKWKRVEKWCWFVKKKLFREKECMCWDEGGRDRRREYLNKNAWRGLAAIGVAVVLTMGECVSGIQLGIGKLGGSGMLTSYAEELWIPVSVTAETAQAAENAAELPVQAPEAILMEASTGTILYEKNADEARNPASVTKIMTLLLIFDALHSGKRISVLRTQFAIDKKLYVEQVENNNDSYIVSVDSDLMPEPIFDEISVQDFREDWIKFNWNNQQYIYYVPFRFPLYRIDNGAWKSFSQEIWIGDITQESSIDLYGCKYDKICLLTSTGQIIEEAPGLKTEGVFSRFSAGFLLSYKSHYDYVGISLLAEDRYQDGILCYNKCILDEAKTTVIYSHEDKAIVVTPYFYGQGNIRFKVIDDVNNVIYTSFALDKDVPEYVYDLSSFINYKVIFFEKERGLSLKKERILKEFPIVFYAREDFIGKSFKIKEVYFDQFVRGEFLRKKHYFNTTYVYFKEMISGNEYIGEVYVRTYHGAFMLDNINPVDIEICSDVIDGMIELSITKDGDGLLLDFEHHGIMNSMDDDKAVDIFSYNIDMKGVESV